MSEYALCILSLVIYCFLKYELVFTLNISGPTGSMSLLSFGFEVLDLVNVTLAILSMEIFICPPHLEVGHYWSTNSLGVSFKLVCCLPWVGEVIYVHDSIPVLLTINLPVYFSSNCRGSSSISWISVASSAVALAYLMLYLARSSSGGRRAWVHCVILSVLSTRYGPGVPLGFLGSHTDIAFVLALIRRTLLQSLHYLGWEGSIFSVKVVPTLICLRYLCFLWSDWLKSSFWNISSSCLLILLLSVNLF